MNFFQNAWLCIPGNITVHGHRCGNNRSHHNFSTYTSPLRKLATLIIQDAEKVFVFYPFFLVILGLSRFFDTRLQVTSLGSTKWSGVN
jgi:hypothetical protein